MASPNTLKLREPVKAPDLWVSGSAMALTMKAENEAYRRWAHDMRMRHGDDLQTTRRAFFKLPDVQKRIQAMADEMVKARK